MQDSKLYVGNLSYSATPEELKALFSEYGQVQDVKLFQDKGFGFVEMADAFEAGKAKDALDGLEFKGRKIKVDRAKPPKERPQRNREGFQR